MIVVVGIVIVAIVVVVIVIYDPDGVLEQRAVERADGSVPEHALYGSTLGAVGAAGAGWRSSAALDVVAAEYSRYLGAVTRAALAGVLRL